MKKFLIILTGITAVTAILLYSSWLFLNSSFLAGLLAQKCRELSGSALIFKKNPRITLFPTTINMDDIFWQGDKKELDINFSARHLRVSFDLSSLLLNDQIRIREIYASEASLKIQDKGEASPHPSHKRGDDEQDSAPGEKLPLLLDRIVLRNSSFSWAGSGQELRLSRMNLSAENIGPRQEADIKCDFFAALGTSGDKEGIAGNMAIRTRLRYYAPNLTFRQTALTFTGTQGAALVSFSPVSLEAEGSINLKDLSVHLNSSRLKASPCQLTFKGDYLARENSGDGHITLDYDPAPAQGQLDEVKENTKYNIVLASPVQYRDNMLKFPDIAISSSSSKGSGNLKYIFSSPGRPSRLTGKLAFCALNLPQKKKDEKSPSSMNVGQYGEAGYKNFAWPDIDISFSAPGLNYGRFSSQDISFHIQGESGKYELKNLRFLWASGKAEGSGHIDMSDQLLMLKTKGSDINIGKALWELGLDGFQDGRANFETNLAFAGFDGIGIKKSLAGNFSFNASQVKISLLEEMAKFLSRFSPKASILPNGIDLFSVRASAENGRINLDPLLLESRELKATAHGNIDLATERLNAQLSLNVFGMNLPVSIEGDLSNLSWRIEPAWFKRFF